MSSTAGGLQDLAQRFVDAYRRRAEGRGEAQDVNAVDESLDDALAKAARDLSKALAREDRALAAELLKLKLRLKRKVTWSPGFGDYIEDPNQLADELYVKVRILLDGGPILTPEQCQAANSKHTPEILRKLLEEEERGRPWLTLQNLGGKHNEGVRNATRELRRVELIEYPPGVIRGKFQLTIVGRAVAEEQRRNRRERAPKSGKLQAEQ